MTLLPLKDPRIRGVDGPKYKVGPYCDAPSCSRIVDHAHHLWRRSFLAGDYWWVQVPDDDDVIVIGNVIGLCWRHHQDVTGSAGGHRAMVFYDGLLHWLEKDGETGFRQIGPVPIRLPDEPLEAPVIEQGRCEKCGRRLPHRKPEGLKKRDPRRKTRFQLMVPQDSEEDGHALLTSLIDDCAERMGRGEGEAYYALVDALNWFLLNYDPAEDEAA